MSAAIALDHVALRVPDLDGAATWLQTAYGLAAVEGSPGERRLVTRPADAVLSPAEELTLLGGARAALDHIAFSVPDEAHLEAVADAAGVDRDGDGAVWLKDPNGLPVQVRLAPPPRPRPPGASPVDLLRLGHVTLTAPDPPAVAEFYRRALGFELAERYGDRFLWLYCNRDHHTLACVEGEPGLQHLAFELRGSVDMVALCDHLAAQGVEVEYGPGRHGPGHNIFLYVLDPCGVRTEFFCDLQRIDDPAAHRAKDWGEDARQRGATNRWGPPPPASFTTHQNSCCGIHEHVRTEPAR